MTKNGKQISKNIEKVYRKKVKGAYTKILRKMKKGIKNGRTERSYCKWQGL